MPWFLRSRCCFVLATAVVLSLVSTEPAFAQLPQAQLWALAPTGGKQASDVSVRITSGADLERVDRLVFSHPGIKAAYKPGAPLAEGLPPEPSREFIVTIGADVPVGVYDARVVGAFGISNPRAFVVGDAPEMSEEADNHTPAKATRVPLGSVVNAAVNAAKTDYFRFEAEAGARVLLDLTAQRIDSRLDATLVLYDTAGRELARSRDANRRDPFIDFTAPAKGEYVASVVDLLFNGGDEYFYRLSISTRPHIDFVLPSSGLPGTKVDCTLFGRNLPGGQPAGISVEGRPLDKLTVSIDFPAADTADKLHAGALVASPEATLDGFEYRLKTPAGASNAVLLGFASAPVVLEKEPNNDPLQPQMITLPAEIVGQFFPRGNFDWYQFEAKRGGIYQIEVVSQRLAQTTDPQLLLQRVKKDDKGVVLASDIVEMDDERELGDESFSTASGDPSYRFVVPEDGTYRLLVRDLNEGRDDPRRSYRVSIREAKPDFRVIAVAAMPKGASPKQNNQPGAEAKPWSVLLRRGGVGQLHLIAARRDGFDGTIEVTAEGLPPGVACAPVTLGSGQDDAPLVFTAAGDAAAWAGAVRIVGRATINAQPIAHEARSGVAQWPNKPTRNAAGSNRIAEARLAREIVLAVTDQETLPVRVEFGPGKSWDASRAGKLEIPIKLTRREGFKEAVTVTADGPKGLFKSQPATIAAGASEGKITLDIDPKAPLGVTSIYLAAATKFSYPRDATGVKQAAELKKQVEKLAAEVAKSDDAAKKKAIEAAKATISKRADEATKAGAAKETALVLPSNVVALAIKPAPVELELPTAELTVKRGAQVEAPVAMRRLYNYAEVVELEVVLPAGLKDLKATAPAIAKDKAEGKLTIVAGPNATPGAHTFTLRAKPKYNNQVLQTERTFKVKVE